MDSQNPMFKIFRRWPVAIPGWMDPSKLLMTVAMNATANTGNICSPTSESSCLPSLKGSRSSVILNEYPSPIKKTRKLHTANTLMVMVQKQTEMPRILGKEFRHHQAPQTRARPDLTRAHLSLFWFDVAWSGSLSVFSGCAGPDSRHTGNKRISGSDRPGYGKTVHCSKNV